MTMTTEQWTTYYKAEAERLVAENSRLRTALQHQVRICSRCGIYLDRCYACGTNASR